MLPHIGIEALQYVQWWFKQRCIKQEVLEDVMLLPMSLEDFWVQKLHTLIRPGAGNSKTSIRPGAAKSIKMSKNSSLLLYKLE